MKKIILVIPNLRGGGSEKTIVNLSNFFVNKNYKVILITVSKNHNDYKSLIDNKIKMISLNSSRTLFSLFKLRRILNKEKPQYVISVLTHINVLCCISSIFLKNKLIILEHIPVLQAIYSKWSEIIVYLFAIIFYKRADTVISTCNDLNYDLRNYLLVPNNKIKVFYIPVTDKKYIELSKEKINNIFFNNKDNNLKKIITVARLEKQKDYVTALKSVKILADSGFKFRYFILGQGSQKFYLQKLVHNLKLDDYVVFLGFSKNPYKYIANSDLFLLTSQFESFGMVLAESLMLGTPVVSTNCFCGPSEIIDNENLGFLVNVKDPISISNGIVKSLKKKYDKQILINKSNKYSIEVIGKYYLDLFSKLESDK